MKIPAIKAIALGVAAFSLSATAAQAGVLTTSTRNNGTQPISPAAYRIEDLQFNSQSYNIDFRYGDFDTVFNGNPTPFSENATFTDGLGDAILNELTGEASEVISNVPGFNEGGTFGNFLLPVSATGTNPNQDTFLDCIIRDGSCSSVDRADSQRSGDQLIYATYEVAAAGPTGGGDAVPTPAMIPGLIGMGWAAMRKKQKQLTGGTAKAN